MPLSQEIDWLADSAVAVVRTVPARVVARFYWYYLKVIWRLPPKLLEQRFADSQESKFARDMVAAFIEGLRLYAQRTA